jgi:hypothetical protein
MNSLGTVRTEEVTAAVNDLLSEGAIGADGQSCIGEITWSREHTTKPTYLKQVGLEVRGTGGQSL